MNGAMHQNRWLAATRRRQRVFDDGLRGIFVAEVVEYRIETVREFWIR